MTTRPRPLDDEEIERRLADLPGVYRGAATTLVLAVRAPCFEDAVRLVDLVAQDAEAMDHHPEVHLRLRVVTFTLTTNWERGHPARRRAGPPDPAGGPVRGRRGAAGPRAGRDRHRLRRRRRRPAVLGGRPRLCRAAGGRRRVGAARPAGPRPGAVVPADGPAATGEGPVHLDVHVPDDAAPGRVQACLAAGGVLVSDAHAPAWWVLADPEGNELCVCTRRPEGAQR